MPESRFPFVRNCGLHNSGHRGHGARNIQLKARNADIAESDLFDLDIQVWKEVDRELYTKENVITSDSVILDHCVSWVNLMEEIVK